MTMFFFVGSAYFNLDLFQFFGYIKVDIACLASVFLRWLFLHCLTEAIGSKLNFSR